MSVTGSTPDDMQRVGVPIADLLAGIYGAYGVLAALYERRHSGRGQVVRTSLLAAVVGRTDIREPLAQWPGTWGTHKAITTRRSRRTGCFAAETEPCRSHAATKQCGSGCARNSPWKPPRTVWAATLNESHIWI